MVWEDPSLMAIEGRDELDVARARRIAWRLWNPASADALAVVAASEPSLRDADVAAPAEASRPAEPPEGVTAAEIARAEYVRVTCESLADGVDRAWALTDAAQAAAATGRLVRRAASLGLDLSAISARPLQSVRLARLAVRHYRRLTRAARAAFVETLLWLDLGHREAADLLLDVARQGNVQVAGTLQFVLQDGWEAGRARASFVILLGAVLDDEAYSWTSRVIALDWLAMVTAREAVESLQWMLSQPHLGVRSRALEILLRMESRPLTRDDVSEMLFDLLDHPLPENASGDACEAAENYAENLAVAVAALPPPEGHTVLVDILVQSDATDCDRPCGPGWALRVLAAAYPAKALSLVDEWLASRVPARRRLAVEAAAKLPREQALPRLRAAAADGSVEVSARARDCWLAAEGTRCVLGPVEGVPESLLEGPPSEAMVSRMLVLRHGSVSVRAAMVEALLATAPDPEALGLLAYVLQHEDLWNFILRPALPKDHDGWVRAILDGFGARGITALFALARPSPHIPDPWLGALLKALRAGTVPTALYPAITHGAVALCAGDGFARDAILLMRVTGFPDAVLQPLWRLAVERVAFALSEATAALVSWPPDPALDDRLASEMSAALARKDYPRMSRLASVAVPRHVPGCSDDLRTALEATEEVTTDVDTEALCAISYWLFANGELSDAWVLDTLAHPELRRFQFAVYRACNAWGKDRTGELSRRASVLLRRALRSDARAGAAAAEAAEALVDMGLLSARSRVIVPIARAAPPRERMRLFSGLSIHRAPLGAVWPAFAELFASEDPEVIDDIQSILITMDWDDAWPSKPRLRAVLPTVKDPTSKYMIEEILGQWELKDYWVDKG